MPNQRADGEVLPSSRLAPFLFPLLFTILTLAIGGVTWHFYVTQTEALVRGVHSQLLTTADSKARQIADWRGERRGQGRVIGTVSFAAPAMKHMLAGRATVSEREALVERLRSICTNLRYAGAVLVDTAGRPALWEGRKFGDTGHLKALMEKVLESGDIVERDFDTGEVPHSPHLGLNIPLRSGPGDPIFGGLLLSIDPQDYLNPLLQWPVPSRSGEVMLVRREGDSVLLLTATRRNPNAALREKVALSRRDVAEVMAAEGRQGVVEAVDYQGVPVYAALRAVPGTPWFLIAKLDRDEATEPIRRRTTLAGVTAISLILTAGALLFFLWRREQLKQDRARFEAETAHRRMTEQYDNLSRLANDVILLVDAEGRILTANDRVASMYGYSAAEIQGMHVWQLRGATPDPVFRDQWNGAREKRSDIFESVHTRCDGEEFPVEVSTRTVAMDGQQLQQAIVRDISDRKQAARDLSESESRFRQLVESAPYAILVVEGTAIVYANAEAVRLFGAPADTVLSGRSMLELVHPEELLAVEQRIRELSEGVDVPAAERRYRRLNGDQFWVVVNATRIVYGGRTAALLFYRDITEAKAAEAERERLEEQLRQAQKMESVGRLAGGVAHDFNNYLTVINGYCDMLLAEPQAAETREGLSEIRAAGERAASITQQLLTFSRKQIASIRVVSVNHVVRDSDQLLRRLIGEDFELVNKLHAAESNVLIDPSQLGQVLMNLVINARDAMPGGGRIVIETSEETVVPADDAHATGQAGAYVVLAVSDSGSGISPELQERIFEPFFTTKGVGVGTGLGLSTAYGIVQQAGGWIKVRSELGAGARFEVWLPLTEAVDGCGTASEALPDATRGSETLLVVEDQAEVRRLTLSILRASGYRLLEAESGAEALRISAAHAGKIDLLVTDVIMPGLNGRQLAERLVAQRPGLKVLYTSGYASDVIAQEGSLEPGMEYLRKPFGAAELSSKVREVLESAGPGIRVLVIDDDAAVRGWLRHILSGAGHIVVEAADGKAGMAELQRQELDLVITDLVMPEQEGLEVLQKIHAQRPGLPVIAISGAFGGSFLKVAEHLGAVATLGKPVDAGLLLEAVRVTLASRGAKKDATAQT